MPVNACVGMPLYLLYTSWEGSLAAHCIWHMCQFLHARLGTAKSVVYYERAESQT